MGCLGSTPGELLLGPASAPPPWGRGRRTCVGPQGGEGSRLRHPLWRLSPRQLLHDLDTASGPHPYLVELVEAGKTGMNAGQGLRRWTQEEADAVRTRLRDFLAAEAKSS